MSVFTLNMRKTEVFVNLSAEPKNTEGEQEAQNCHSPHTQIEPVILWKAPLTAIPRAVAGIGVKGLGHIKA
jgi:hypothetical protein